MSVFSKIQAWWRKDDLETAEEETRMTPWERDAAERDFEGIKDDTAVKSGRLGLGAADYERDSERPR